MTASRPSTSCAASPCAGSCSSTSTRRWGCGTCRRPLACSSSTVSSSSSACCSASASPSSWSGPRPAATARGCCWSAGSPSWPCSAGCTTCSAGRGAAALRHLRAGVPAALQLRPGPGQPGRGAGPAGAGDGVRRRGGPGAGAVPDRLGPGRLPRARGAAGPGRPARPAVRAVHAGGARRLVAVAAVGGWAGHRAPATVPAAGSASGGSRSPWWSAAPWPTPPAGWP